MKQTIKKAVFIVKSFFELIYSIVIYNYYKNKYKKTDYFDYKKLINTNFIEPRGFNAVCHYGNYKAVKKLTGKRFNFITDYLEHGASISSDPETIKGQGYYNRPTIRRIYAMSEFNVAVYNECIKNEKLKSKAIAVGPYIQGADFFYSKSKLDEIKNKYGHILLVFPQHSCETMKAEYDIDNFIKTIQYYKKEHNFDSVFVCIYWADILMGRDEKYLQNGFVVVSAGYRSDPRFLSRLKDIIYLSDNTITNSLGTYIGYAISMGKPIFLYNQTVQYYINGEKLILSLSLEKETQKFYDTFNVFTTTITPEQYQLIEKYWGKWKND